LLTSRFKWQFGTNTRRYKMV